MPKITLRLTDGQHEKLVEDSQRNHRSVQGEIVHRLFAPPPPGATPPPGWEDHFKPDPKPGKK
jgi:hypothetical protein